MGSTGKSKTNGADIGKVIQLPVETVKPEPESKSMVDNENGWDYPGIREYIDEIELKLSRARSTRTVTSIYRALQGQDEQITREIEHLHNGTADIEGSEKALLTYRRRVRQLMRKAQF